LSDKKRASARFFIGCATCGVSLGATQYPKTAKQGATRLWRFGSALQNRLQWMKTLPLREYCPAWKWSYNAPVFKPDEV
jgi:hypothetical protein